MDKKILSAVILSAFFVTSAYSAEESFKRIDPWTVIIYKSDANSSRQIRKEKNVTGLYSPEVAFKRIDPWTVVISRDSTKKVEIARLTHSQYYTGFQPVMASHFPKFDFDHDGMLSREECRKGNRRLDGSV